MKELQAIIFNIQRFSIHDGPGIRTTIFFKGCPLRCSWCSNPESQKKQPEPIWDNIKKQEIIIGRTYSIEEVLEVIRKDRDYYEESNGGVTVTGGEVLAQKDFVVELLSKCQQEGIHTACETSAYASNRDFIDLMEHVDLLIMDIKHHDSDKHRRETGVSLAPILANLDTALSANKEMLLRIPVIPNFNDSLEDAHEFGKLLKAHGAKDIELLPFHQFGKSKYKFLKRTYAFESIPQLTSKDLEPFAAILSSYGLNCKIA